MVKLRLQRKGRKSAPFYHIVVADSRSPRDGKFIEKIGTLPADFQCAEHFVFGHMNAKEWGVLAHKHIDHHLKQFGA